jgi:serine/threonine protein kinase/formylglycine-generating enzyme required for sulfatase activity
MRLDALTIPEADRIDATCDRFEAAWTAGDATSIEGFLAGASGPSRMVLLRELLELELEFRVGVGEIPTVEEYHARFAEEAGLVDEIFAGTRRWGGWHTPMEPSVTPPGPVGEAETENATTLGWVPIRADDFSTAGVAPRRVLGPYDILEQIGTGGMGVVYRAFHRDARRHVALKLIRGGWFGEATEASTGEATTRFVNEAQALARLEHDHIVPIYDVGHVDGLLYFAMRLIRGKTLAQVIRREGALEPRRAVYYAEAAARAIQHAHESQYLHRDLKPGNLMVDELDRPFVLDFGLTKCLEQTDFMTLTGNVLGTPEYMSPEQARGDPGVGYATDVYGLGATLFSLLTGRPPFSGPNRLAVLRRVIDEEPAWPPERNKAVGRELKAICLKCLEKDPARRFKSAGDLATALRKYLNYEDTGVVSPGVATRVSKWIKRKPWRAVAVVAVAVATLVLAGASAWNAYRESGVAQTLVADLLKVPLPDVLPKIESMNGHRRWVEPRLRELLQSGLLPADQRARVELALLPSEPQQATYLVGRLLECGPEEHRVLREGLRAQWPEIAARAVDALGDPGADPARRTRAAAALIALDSPKAPAGAAWSVLRLAEDPGPRVALLDWLVQQDTDPGVLASHLDSEPDASIRRLLIQAMAGRGRGRPGGTNEVMAGRLLKLYAADPDPGVHSSLAHTLRRWGFGNEIARVDADLAGKPRGDRSWYVTPSGLTMAVVAVTGARPKGPGQLPDRFAIATTETPLSLYLLCVKNHLDIRISEGAPPVSDLDSPADCLSYFDAARFCNWLSEREGLPRDQWCYLPGTGDGVLILAPDYLTRRGYRMPTVPEWEYAVRAGTATNRYFGDTPASCDDYAWNQGNGGLHPWPVGQLRPNDFGLFDVLGNVMEWCYHPDPDHWSRCECQAVRGADCLRLRHQALRGGWFAHTPQSLGVRNTNRIFDELLPNSRVVYAGLRVVKSDP